MLRKDSSGACSDESDIFGPCMFVLPQNTGCPARCRTLHRLNLSLGGTKNHPAFLYPAPLPPNVSLTFTHCSVDPSSLTPFLSLSSAMPPTTLSSEQFFAALRTRRSVYALKRSSPISDAAIRELIETSINLAPTAYNSQTSRVALVFGDKHKRMWDAIWTENQKTFPSGECEEQVAPWACGDRQRPAVLQAVRPPGHTVAAPR